IVEVYSDTFEAVGNPYGMAIKFNLSPLEVQAHQLPRPVANVRLSWEMSKVLTFVLLRYIKKTEEDRGVSYPIPVEILNTLKIAKEDWDGFWSTPKLDIGGID
ncbi:unnamed protein product, partial [marine sediment metagenome]